jgi:hypothetical protein
MNLFAILDVSRFDDIFGADDTRPAELRRATFELGRDPITPPEPGEPEFEPADPVTVCAVRLELERMRRRHLAEATPVPPWPRDPDKPGHGDL